MIENRETIVLNPSTDKEEFDRYYDMWLTGKTEVTNNLVQSQYMFYENYDSSATEIKVVNLEEYKTDLINLLNEFKSFLGSNTQMNIEVQDFLDTKLYNFIINSRDILNEFIKAKNDFDEGVENLSTVNKIKYLYLLLPFDLIITSRNQIFDGTNLFEILTNLIEYLTDTKGKNDKYLFEISNDKFNINELYEEKLRQYNEFIEKSKDIIYDESRYNNIR